MGHVSRTLKHTHKSKKRLNRATDTLIIVNVNMFFHVSSAILHKLTIGLSEYKLNCCRIDGVKHFSVVYCAERF